MKEETIIIIFEGIREGFMRKSFELSLEAQVGIHQTDIGAQGTKQCIQRRRGEESMERLDII